MLVVCVGVEYVVVPDEAGSEYEEVVVVVEGACVVTVVEPGSEFGLC